MLHFHVVLLVRTLQQSVACGGMDMWVQQHAQDSGKREEGVCVCATTTQLKSTSSASGRVCGVCVC